MNAWFAQFRCSPERPGWPGAIVDRQPTSRPVFVDRVKRMGTACSMSPGPVFNISLPAKSSGFRRMHFAMVLRVHPCEEKSRKADDDGNNDLSYRFFSSSPSCVKSFPGHSASCS
jgi:hypothetical protein